MNEQELKESLSYFLLNRDQIGVAIYAISKDIEQLEPKKLDISSDAQTGLKSLFLDHIQQNIANEENLSLLNLSTSDERIDAIYIYDLEVPDEFKAMDTVLESDNLNTYNLVEDNISNIKALLIEIGNDEHQLVLYKILSNVNVFGRSSFFLIKDETRLKQIEDEFLRISPNFQLMKINDELLVTDLKALERSFGFHEVIIREAGLGVDAIEAIMILENIEVLRELLGDVKYARRFVKVANSSPVLQKNIPNTRIIEFCQTFPALAGKIQFNATTDKIVLDTNISKDLFIKLLMDSYLTSELTASNYESIAKDNVDEVSGS